ncbi:MAG: hypothetical protein OEN48_16585 [Betaproteobacteria bacterium]|nr:hypothetical protein [Betaproteobacteria bacterium]
MKFWGQYTYFSSAFFLSSAGWTMGEPAVRDAFQPLNEFLATQRPAGARVFRDARADKSSDFIKKGVRAEMFER